MTNIAVLPNGVSYHIPSVDVTFFKELAARMKWKVTELPKKAVTSENLELERAMDLMDTMRVREESVVPADEDCNGALARVKYEFRCKAISQADFKLCGSSGFAR